MSGIVRALIELNDAAALRAAPGQAGIDDTSEIDGAAAPYRLEGGSRIGSAIG